MNSEQKFKSLNYQSEKSFLRVQTQQLSRHLAYFVGRNDESISNQINLSELS